MRGNATLVLLFLCSMAASCGRRSTAPPEYTKMVLVRVEYSAAMNAANVHHDISHILEGLGSLEEVTEVSETTYRLKVWTAEDIDPANVRDRIAKEQQVASVEIEPVLDEP